MTIKVVTGTLMALVVLVGSVFGGVIALDQRYVSTAQFVELSVEVYTANIMKRWTECRERKQTTKQNM